MIHISQGYWMRLILRLILNEVNRVDYGHSQLIVKLHSHSQKLSTI